MAPPRMQPHDLQSVGEDQLSTAYSLLLLSEYNHTLDSLPLDLSRNFADLRELDAVLSSSMQTMTTKITNLTTMIEEGKTPPSDRLNLLHELAEEAGRLKLGGDDKIRVACQAADNLKAHNSHLRNLTDTLPGFDTSVLIRKTQYPHVSAQSFMPVHTTEHGRRRRNAAGSLLTAQSNTADPSPAKRKRVVNRDDDIDIGSIKSPRKERVETNGRGRGNNRVKKVERAPSPADSDVLSVNYRQPSQNARSTGATSRAANASGSTNKRARGNANSNRNGTPLSHADYANTSYDPRFPSGIVQQNGAPPSSGRRDAYGAAQTNLSAYTNGAAAGMVNGVGNHQQIMQAYEMHNLHLQNWNPTTGQPLEGPGMPVSRNTNHVSAATAAAAAASAAAMAVDNGGTDGDGDADDARYCFCNGVSYGEMIGCDGESCEREWFHLACIGLDAPPSGNWFCDDCKNKRNQKRTARGGKRRAGGGRGSGKNA